MAVVVLTSAKGAPGVTTTALAFALLWPRPVVLVEADVAGGSSILAGYLRGSIPHSRSLLTLALAHRQGRLDDELWQQSVPLDEAGERHLVPAIIDPVQAASLAPVWAPLATAFASLERGGVDVIVDAGRLGAAHGPEPLLRLADVVLLLTRSQLPAVAATRARLLGLRERAPETGMSPDGLGLLLVGEGRPYTCREIAKVIGVSVVTSLAWDPAAADVLSVGAPRPRRWEQSALVRSARSAVQTTRALVEHRRSGLDPDFGHNSDHSMINGHARSVVLDGGADG